MLKENPYLAVFALNIYIYIYINYKYLYFFSKLISNGSGVEYLIHLASFLLGSCNSLSLVRTVASELTFLGEITSTHSH